MIDGTGTVKTQCIVLLLWLGTCHAVLHYQPLETSINSDDCALILNGPGRTSAYDYTYNLLRGRRMPTSGSHTCITYDAVNRAYLEAQNRIKVAHPTTEIWKPEELATVGELLLDISTTLAQIYGLTREEIENGLPQIDTSKTLIRETCPAFVSNVECRPGKYRRFDGLCTNLEHPTWGAALSPFTRLMLPAFADGISAPRISVTGGDLPLARVVSRTMHPDEGFHDHAGTVMVIAWGQFMDHDYTLTATPLDPLNRNDPEECCDRPPHLKNPYCNEIKIPDDDYFYRLFHVKCMDFVRAFPAVRPECRLGSRVPFNLLTGVLDGNTVYGIREEFANKLRAGHSGLLRMNPVFAEYGLKDLLPLKLDIPDEGCTRPNASMYCFEGGEIRVNEQLVLTCMHTLMAREHNRIAKALAEVNPHWDDDILFQEARRINIAEIQHVTYNEFLPILLGQEVMQKFGLMLEKYNYWDGHDPSINPGVIDAFAAAAFRFGHSLLPTAVERWSKAHKFIASKRLSDLIRRPFDLYRAGVIDEYFMGLMNQVAQAMDDSITQEVTNHLFKKVGARFGMDLVSFNMQRGREFGIPSYMEFRKLCGLPVAHTFDDLLGIMPNETIRRYSSIFTTPADIDLWSGGVSERPLPGSMLGPTFACVIATQFSHSRRGDRFWYELPNQPSSFTLDQLNEIRKARLARLICDNTDLINTLQLYPMVLPDHEINPRVPCRTGIIPSIDFTKWAEFPTTSATSQFKTKTPSPWMNSYVVKVTQWQSPFQSHSMGPFYRASSLNFLSSSWKLPNMFKPKNLKEETLHRLKRSVQANTTFNQSKITKRYSNLAIVGIKPENLYRHPGLSVEDQVRTFNTNNKKKSVKSAVLSDTYRKILPDLKDPRKVLPLVNTDFPKLYSKTEETKYNDNLKTSNDTITASEIFDLNTPIQYNKLSTTIVVPEESFYDNEDQHKIPQESKQSNGTYVNLQDHQAILKSSTTKDNPADIPPYDPANIPYVDVPDYTDRQEESLDSKDKETSDSDLNNDAVDPDTLPNGEGEKSSSFVGSESERTKVDIDEFKKLNNHTDKSNEKESNHQADIKDTKVDGKFTEKHIADISNKSSEIKINTENITESPESIEGDHEPVDFNIEEYMKPFDLDKFIDELFHRSGKRKTDESRLKETVSPKYYFWNDSGERGDLYEYYTSDKSPYIAKNKQFSSSVESQGDDQNYFAFETKHKPSYRYPVDSLAYQSGDNDIGKFEKHNVTINSSLKSKHTNVNNFLSTQNKKNSDNEQPQKFHRHWILEYGIPSLDQNEKKP